MSYNEFSKALCDERHKNVETMFRKIDSSMDTLFQRLNYFYIVAIGTLAAALSSIVIVFVTRGGN